MSTWNEERIKELEVNVQNVQAKTSLTEAMNIRHLIWAIVAVIVATVTIAIICKTATNVTKINTDYNIEKLHSEKK